MDRDLLREKKAIEQFQLRTGRDPNPVDQQDIYKSIYGDQLPYELQNTQMASGSTLNALKGSQTPGTTLSALQTNLTNAQGRVGALSSPNTALNTLQEALKIKTGGAQASVGPSDIFAKAGVTGYGALSQSLAARSDEIKNDITNYKDVINNMAGIYKDQANAALQQLDTAYKLYTNETDRIDKLNEQITAHKNAIELEKIREEADKQLAVYRSTLSKNEEFYKSQLEGGQIDLSTGELVKPTGNAQQIADAIKVAEGGVGYDYKTPGRKEIGAYQFMPATWEVWSGEYAKSIGENPKTYTLTPAHQDAIAQFKIQQWLDQGLSADQIFAKWNSGQTEYKGRRGISSITGEPYDVESYVNRGLNALKRIAATGGTKFTPEFYKTDYGQKVLNNEQQYQQNFLSQPVIKEYLEVQNKAASVRKIIDAGVGGPGDLALVFDFMKGLDPTSVVRESEYATAASSGNIFQGVFSRFNGYLKESGGFLPPNVKEAFNSIVQTKLDIKQQQYNKLRDQFRKTASEQDLNPEHVAPDLTIDFGIGKKGEQNLITTPDNQQWEQIP